MGVWGLEFIFFFISSLIGYTILKRRWGTLTAISAVTVGGMGAIQLFGSGNSTEEYTILFSWISLYAFSCAVAMPHKYHYPFIMGLMLGLVFMLRANNFATPAAALLIWFILTSINFSFKFSIKRLLSVLGGIILALLPCVVYFASNGALDELLEASITYNFSYSFTTRSTVYKFDLLRSSIIPAFRKLHIWMIIPFIGYLFTLYQLFIVKEKRRDPMDWLIFIAWPIEVIASSISGRGYGHYFICWLPIMTLSASVFFQYFQRYVLNPNFLELINQKKPWLGFITMIVLLSIIFSDTHYQYLQTAKRLVFNRDQGIEYISPIAEYILRNTNPEDKVLVWGGQVGINLMSDRESSSGFIFYPLYSNSEIGRELQKSYYQDLVNNQPPIIIDASKVAPDELPSLDPEIYAHQRILYPLADNIQQVLDYIAENYTYVDEIDGYPIYRLNNQR